MKAPNKEARTVAAGEFKAKCLHLLDEVRESRQPLVITKRGVPCATVVPFAPAEKKAFRSVFGRTRGAIVHGDIVAPLPEEWTLPEEFRDK